MTNIIFVPLDEIEPNPWQPRNSDDPEHIEKIAHSIAADGLLQYPVARRAGDKYQLAFGHSRFKAFQFLNARTGIWFTERGYPVKSYDKMPLQLHELGDEVMFRYAVGENLARKDLNAIETASAMKRYRDEFGKSSAEIGALFGVNDATVRGTLRLLDLPAGARELLGKGKMSQGAARALLSVRNLVDENIIEQIAQEIVASEGISAFTDIIQKALNKQRNILMMWQESAATGRPRAGMNWHKSEKYWLLTMKNFPNYRLPSLTLSDAATLTENSQILRVFAHAKNTIAAEVMLGAMEDDESKKMAETLAILHDPPSCDSCPFYGRLGKMHYCGLRFCHMRKKKAWDEERIFQIAKKTGVDLYDERDGKFVILKGYDARHQALWKERVPDLRIIQREKIRGEYPSQFSFEDDGIDQELCVVCVVGKSMLELKDLVKAERAMEKAGILSPNNRYAMAQNKRERLLWEAANFFADELFGAMNLEAVKALEDCLSAYGLDEGPKFAQIGKIASDEEKFDFLRRKLALNMIHRLRPPIEADSRSRTCMIDFYETVELAAQKVGVHLPDSLRRAASEADTEIEISFPVSAETIEVE